MAVDVCERLIVLEILRVVFPLRTFVADVKIRIKRSELLIPAANDGVDKRIVSFLEFANPLTLTKPSLSNC